ncbi:MarR family winged helix-turn-helix transcriptional regulator [Crossiella cryophila]|uniref:DNA-binding MarR family transcriptional regulator n=1 Tax=Crossiella cryophila TaxID=43355 RepID=A0A7W7C685_9PSEU|nr:MarR family transcriptional regulator [Crossiella cryophila]MBB4675295.1 DNA-binding MarR family transcriptional regulator [Crossiella cryophila]
MDETGLAQANEIGMALVRLNRATACMAAQSAKLGIDKTSFTLLATLVHTGPLRSSALAEAVYSDPSTISRQVAQLVKDGLVERTADPLDGRATLLAATESGRELFLRHRDRRNEMIASMVSGWPPEDRRQFATLLHRFVGAYEEHMPGLIAELVDYARSGVEK